MNRQVTNKMVLVLGGPSGAGKTVLGQQLVAGLKAHGVMAELINDYEIFGRWFEANKHRPEVLKPEGETYLLQPGAYSEISRDSGDEVVAKTSDCFDRGVQVVMVETAKGAWGEDNYGEYVLKPLFEAFSGDGVMFGNCEVLASRENAFTRAEKRSQANSEAPPAGVALRYFDETGQLYCSSTEDAAALMAEGYPIAINVRVDNNGPIADIDKKAEGIVQLALGRIMPSGPEGQRDGSPERW